MRIRRAILTLGLAMVLHTGTVLTPARAAIVNVGTNATLTLGAASGAAGVHDGGVYFGLWASRFIDNSLATGQGIVDGGFWDNDARATVNYDPVYLYFTFASKQTIGGFGLAAGFSENLFAVLEFSTDSGTTWQTAASQLVQANSFNSDGTSARFPPQTAKNWRLVVPPLDMAGDSFGPARGRIRGLEIYLWSYTDADAASLPATKQVNADMYVKSVDIAGDGLVAEGYNNYTRLVQGNGSGGNYVNRDGQPSVTATNIFDQPRAISGFGMLSAQGLGSVLLEYSTDSGTNWQTVTGIPGSATASFNVDGTNTAWTFTPITAQYWRYTMGNPANNLYLGNVYFYTTVRAMRPTGTVIFVK